VHVAPNTVDLAVDMVLEPPEPVWTRWGRLATVRAHLSYGDAVPGPDPHYSSNDLLVFVSSPRHVFHCVCDQRVECVQVLRSHSSSHQTQKESSSAARNDVLAHEV
jgi:hypothetical protein